jgi:hypothetical protein
VNVRRHLAGTARVESDHRVEHLDRDPRVCDNGAGKMNPREVGDADLVGPGERPQRPPPLAHEIERAGQPERRKQPLDRGVLIRDRKRRIHQWSPKNLWSATGLSDGTAAEAAVAGRTMRPVPYSMCGRDGANM